MIPGLQIIPNFITADAATILTMQLTAQLENTVCEHSPCKDYRNRVARFGFSYHPPHDWLTLPAWLLLISLQAQKAANATFNSYTLNEYLPGQGIAPHTDTFLGFGNTIAVLSLGSDAHTLWHPPFGREMEIATPANSLTVFSGDIRRDWRHSVPPVKEKRWSIVFRQKLP